jgi:chromosome segregation ATPase
MTTIAEQLDDLKKRSKKLEQEHKAATKEIEKDTKALGDKKTNLDSLSATQQAVSADVDATAKLVNDLEAVTAARKDTRKRGEDEVTKGREELKALNSRIEQELSEPRRTALLEKIKAIDDAISKAGTDSDKAEKALTEAKKAEADAREAATAAAKNHDDAQALLQAVPLDIEAARARVAALRSAATNAVDVGRMAEAFAQARDLEDALAGLDKKLKDDPSEKLSGQLPVLWAEKLASAEKLKTATKEVGPLQTKAAEAQQARDTLIAGRDEQIMKAVNEPPKTPGEDEPPADPPGQPADPNKPPPQ